MKRFVVGLSILMGVGLVATAAQAQEREPRREVRKVRFVTPAPEMQVSAEGETSLVRSRPNSLSLELLGRGLLYSVNYDRAITDYLSLGVGLSYFSIPLIDNHSASFYVLPLYSNVYLLSGSHRPFVSAGADLALGAGGISQRIDSSGKTETTTMPVQAGAVATVGAGYEYRAEGGFLFRLAPYLLLNKYQTMLTGGLSLGASF